MKQSTLDKIALIYLSVFAVIGVVKYAVTDGMTAMSVVLWLAFFYACGAGLYIVVSDIINDNKK